MHLLRNAIDHGIELPEVRSKRGKPPAGRVQLQIEQRGNEIIVRVSDDGNGIDTELIRRKALSSGLITSQELDLLSNDDMRSLIFYPGITTSAEVTPISGRGIGMDVVQDRVESLRGSVSVQSVMGQGTTISLRVPVSLTRIRCVLLHVGEETYAIASAVITRMMTRRRTEIFTAENHEMILIDDQPVPLVSMAEVLGVSAVINPEADLKLMVLHAADRNVAFEVDDLESERELVLKPLGPEIARAQYVSGAALLGTGAAIIVLDANDLIRSATGRTRTAAPLIRIKRQTATIQRQKRVLVVDDSITTRTLEKNILETAGYNVSVAIDVVEAWGKINDESFDVIISDVEMPKMTGLELAALIKQTERTRHIPVILLTSLGKPEQREAGLEAGADAYLVKSGFDQGELLQMIQRVI
jgi:two-component system chemotaxis sensor kinase CheA